MSVGLILGKRPEDCNDCKIVVHNEEEFRCPLCPYYNFTGFDSIMPPDECPLQEVEPVTHGKWKYDRDGLFICTVCGNKERVAQKIGVPIWEYCPSCGAKMEGEEYD